MAQIYEYQDIDAHVILLFVHPAPTNKNGKGVQIVRNWQSPVAIWLACIELIFRELQ